METELDLPKLGEDDSLISQNILKDGSYVIYTQKVSDSKSFSITRYRYNVGETGYKEEKPEWLQNVPVKGSVYNTQILQTTDGTEYLYWVDDKGASLCKTQDKKTMQKLKLEGWNRKSPDGEEVIAPWFVGVLDNGMVVANMFDACYVYDARTGKQKKKIEGYLREVLDVCGNKFVLCKGDDGEETMKSLFVFNSEKLDDDPESIIFDTSIPLNTAVHMENKELILANNKGIHKLIHGTGTWQTVVDGSLNTMYIPNLDCTDVCKDRENNYYILYENFITSERSVMKYQYDKTADAVPLKELTIYTLNDNPMLCAAVNAFEKKHSDFKVSIQVAMSENSGLKKEDYIRSLNTELLSGKGCDLILLDGLPINSYIEKGALSDLSGFIDPLLKKNVLLKNVADCYYKYHKIYAIPSRIKLPMLYGKADAVHACDTLDKMALYARQKKNTPLLGAFTYDDIVTEFLPLYTNKIIDSRNQINRDHLKQFLEDIKIILDRTGCISEYTMKNRKKFYDDLPVSTTLCKDTSDEIIGAGIWLSYTHFVHGAFTTIDNYFEPASVIGINKSSKYQDLAIEFIGYMLSDKIQKMPIESAGFPIRLETLENLKPLKWWGGYDEITYQDGSKGHVPIRDASTADIRKIIGFCKKVSQTAYTDDNVLAAILKGGKSYILDNGSIDKAVEAIENKLSLYSEE